MDNETQQINQPFLRALLRNTSTHQYSSFAYFYLNILTPKAGVFEPKALI